MNRRNHYPKHVFSWVLLNPRTTEQLTTDYRPNDSLNQYSYLKDWTIETCSFCRTQQSWENIYDYTSVYYLKSLWVSIKHIRKSQWYLLNFNLYSSADISKLLSFMDFFSVHSVLYCFIR